LGNLVLIVGAGYQDAYGTVENLVHAFEHEILVV
jgi:hypothetical protein